MIAHRHEDEDVSEDSTAQCCVLCQGPPVPLSAKVSADLLVHRVVLQVGDRLVEQLLRRSASSGDGGGDQLEAHGDGPIMRRELDGVRDKVAQNLLHSELVDVQHILDRVLPRIPFQREERSSFPLKISAAASPRSASKAE